MMLNILFALTLLLSKLNFKKIKKLNCLFIFSFTNRSLNHQGSDVSSSDHQNPSNDGSVTHQYQTHAMPGGPGLLSSPQQPKPEGLDYSLQRSGDVYSSMIPQNRSHLPNQGLTDRRPTPATNQVYGSYDPASTQSSQVMNYTPNTNTTTVQPGNLATSNTLTQMSKTANSRNTPSPSQPMTGWPSRSLQRVIK